MAQNGNIIAVFYNGLLLGGIKSNSLKGDVELDEISSPNQSDTQWKRYDVGRKSANIQVGYLVLATSAMGITGGSGIKDILQMGNEFTLVFKDRGSGGDAGVTGSYILKSVDIQATRGNLVTGSLQFVLNGALTAAT